MNTYAANGAKRTRLKRQADAAPSSSPALRTSARPTYCIGVNPNAFTHLSRLGTQRLITEFHRGVPIVARTIDILAGFVGCPCFKSSDEATAADLKQWARTVQHGQIGTGLHSWIPDYLGQALLYGYSIGELQPTARRDEIERLWSYRSPYFRFEVNEDGDLKVLQPTNFDGRSQTLDPVTVFHTTFQPEGCDPYGGGGLFLSALMFCQGLLDIFHSHRATWRRSGIPTFHVNWEPYNEETYNDPESEIATAVRADLQSAWTGAIGSQARDGVAEDFFSTGKIKITAIGADMAPMVIETSVRAFCEQIIAVTGIPPFFFGLSWSSTERLSVQQADLLLTTIDSLRTLVGTVLEYVVTLRQRLKGNTNDWELEWPDLTLQDQVETAKAELFDAQADVTRQSYWVKNWQLGFCNQQQAAQEIAGIDVPVVSMDAPPSVGPAPDASVPTPNTPTARDETLFRAFFGLKPGETLTDLVADVESAGDYGAGASCNGNGKHHH